MDILLDISPLVVEKRSGIGNYVYFLTDEVLKQDKDNKYILFCFCPIDRLNVMDKFVFSDMSAVKDKRIVPLPSKLSLTFYKYWQSINFPSLEFIANSKPSIVHNHEWFTPPVGVKTKLVSTVFDLTTIINPTWHKEKNVILQNKRLSRLDRASKLITISESSKRDLTEYNKRLEDKTEVIYPGVTGLEREFSETELFSIKQKYSLERPFILTVSTVEPRKNLKVLIQSFKNVQNLIPDDLVIVGANGWKNDEFFNDIKNNNRIKFLEYVSNKELSMLYKTSHFFTYISLYEGFGIPPLEAMSFGKKVLVSNTASLSEVVGSAGIMINPTNIEEIANSLLRLSSKADPDTVYEDSLVQANSFKYKNSAEKLISIYNSLHP